MPLKASALAVSACLWTAGCAPVPRPASPLLSPHYFSRAATLDRGVLELHLAASAAREGPLVLYASGDGGWFGAAVDMFKQLAATGCPVVGFSSRALLKIGRPRVLGLEELASDYATLITQARLALSLPPATPVILTGWSRGAAFAVLAASELKSAEPIDGIIAIGLAEGEDLSVDGAEDETDDGSTLDPAKQWPFEPYSQLARLTSMPAAVIQASRDNYLPASRARELFGPETDDRRFYAVDARNHRFSGAKAAFDRSLSAAMSFVTSRSSSATTSAQPPCS